MKKSKLTSRRRDGMKFYLLLLFLIFSASISSAFAQTTIKGVVTDAQKEPLPGVSVIVKGSSSGTVTDLDGKYNITAKSSDVLTFTYLGMASQSIPVGSKTTIDVVLSDNAQTLTETVVIGYGTAKKADLTGAIGSISADALMKQPAANAAQSMQGKVTGVNIIANDAPGSSPSVIIRGLGTALGGRNPLYIVDGFPADNINNISPSDIVSMDILKDASSSSIYGVRAANGVIIVTTKKGSEGTSRIAVDSYAGVKSILHQVKMANASQYTQFVNENLTALNANYRLAANQANNTDWFGELTNNGFFTNNAVSLQGGGKTVDYFFSYNFYNEDGILDREDYRRTTIRNNNVFKFYNDRLTFKENLNVSFSNQGVVTYGVFNDAYKQSPLMPVYGKDGSYARPRVNTTTGIVTEDTPPAGQSLGSLNSIGNPVFNANRQNQKAGNVNLQGGIEGEFKLTDYLKVNSRFGATKNWDQNKYLTTTKATYMWLHPDITEEMFQELKDANPNDATYVDNELNLIKSENYRWTWEGFLTFAKKFDLHDFNVVAGLSREKYNMGYQSELTGYNVPEQSQYWDLNHATNQDRYPNKANEYSTTPTALASYFGRFQYNYDNKYYLTGTVRRDGSSNFAYNGDKWSTFPSFGAGWTISRENFMQNLTFLDYAKLRAAWGKLGNQNVPFNITKVSVGTTTDPGNYSYIFGPNNAYVAGATAGSPAMPITWEIIDETNIGLDLAFLHDRLTANIDWYNKTTENAVLRIKPTPDSPYADDFLDHGAKVRNRGVELNIGWSDKLANGLAYHINVNWSHNNNQVLDCKPAYDGMTGGSLGNGEVTKRLKNGQPLFAWWMFEADGVWQNQAEIDNPDNAKYGTPHPGYLRYKDQNGDGSIDDRDKKYFGSYVPTSNYGINAGLDYKRFDFNISGYGVHGNKIYNGLKSNRIDGGENIAYDTFKNRWTGEGSTNTDPGANRGNEASSYFLESGAFFRINNITLGYTLNDVVAKGTKLRLYLTAQNPFIFTAYTGFTPELSGYNNDPATTVVDQGAPNGTSGVETGAYPSTRNFLFGLNLSF